MKNYPVSVDRIVPYFLDTHGQLCSLRLASMMVMVLTWLATAYYALAEQPWQGMPGIIIPMLILTYCSEIRFVVEQTRPESSWGPLDPLGPNTDYNGHPSTHRIKTIVCVSMGGVLVLIQAFRGIQDPGLSTIAMFLLFVPLVFNFLFEILERSAQLSAPRRQEDSDRGSSDIGSESRRATCLVKEVP